MREDGLWRRLQRALGPGPPEASAAPPDDEPALVPAGPPPHPLGADAVAFDILEEPDDVDARGS
ncbi:MAG TPA: hypothetical protein VM049_09825 [Gaiellaceae bacterium]|nr:hypothetical protein [Gaiellaceae bacterium]